MEKKLKDFQKATVEHIVNIFKSKKQRRVLLSDEVGLGKTIVSKGVIQAVGELSDEYGIWDDNTYRVVISAPTPTLSNKTQKTWE